MDKDLEKWEIFGDAAQRIMKEFSSAFHSKVVSNSTNAEIRDELNSIVRSIDKLDSKLDYQGKSEGYKGLHLIEHLMLARAIKNDSEQRGLLEAKAPLDTEELYEKSVYEWGMLKQQLNSHRELFELAISNCEKPVKGVQPFIREITRFERMVFDKYVELFERKPALHEISAFVDTLENVYSSLGLETSGLLKRYKQFV